jgi:hypothetical protein
VLLSAATVITPRRSFLTAKLFQQPPLLSACTGALSKPNFLDAFHFNCSLQPNSAAKLESICPTSRRSMFGCLLSVERICAWIEINYNLLGAVPN